MRSNFMKSLQPIPMPHPVIVIGSLLIIGLMLYWSLRTDLREPALWLSTAVVVLVIAVNEASRRSRSRQRVRMPPPR